MNSVTESSTIPVREAHRFDEVRLSEYLVENLAGFAGIVSVRQFRGGQSNPTYLIVGDTEKFVLRKKPPGKLLPSAHLVEREYKVMSALSGSGVPVPAMRLLCEDDTVIGTAFYVMDFLDGRVFSNPALPDTSPKERTAIYAAANEVLARLHTVDYESVGLGGFGKPGAYLERQIATWTTQYLASKTGALEDMDQLIDWLPKNVPEDVETTIAHGDYRLGNLMFHAQEPRIIGVLDWELCTLGHPLADLAYNCMSYDMPAGQSDLPGLSGLDLDALGIPDEQAYLDAYCERTGRTDIGNWSFFMVFVYFRLAAICQGVYHRSLLGNASDIAAEKYGVITKHLARLGCRRLDA